MSVTSATMKVPTPSVISCPRANSDHSSASKTITAPEQQQMTPPVKRVAFRWLGRDASDPPTYLRNLTEAQATQVLLAGPAEIVVSMRPTRAAQRLIIAKTEMRMMIFTILTPVSPFGLS